jgi:hypothetical protein
MTILGAKASHGGNFRRLPTVSGGTLSSDATYFYRTFTSTSSLIITGATLSADFAVVGGGSGGGGNNEDTPPGTSSSVASVLTSAGALRAIDSLYQAGGHFQAGKSPVNGVDALGVIYAGGGGSGATPFGSRFTPQNGGTGGGGNGGNTSSSRNGQNGTTGGGGGGSGSNTSARWGGTGGNGGQVRSTSASDLLGTYTVTIGAGGSGTSDGIGAQGGNGGGGIVVVRYLRTAVA